MFCGDLLRCNFSADDQSQNLNNTMNLCSYNIIHIVIFTGAAISPNLESVVLFESTRGRQSHASGR